ncbi:MAG: hypothetical protein J3Q66DRAFT_356103 [Benniella sp.]|nr:MAG: hypothetical protein J3Q66DRAFT_356103 [Benniella sp.]
MSLKLVKPPTSGSALLQFFTAALRQAGSRQDSDIISEEDDDLVHVNNDGEGLLGPDHAPEVHSDGEGGSLGDDHAHQSKEGHLAPERERAMSEDGEISRSIGAISIGSARDRLTFAERLQTVIGYPEVEEVIGDYSCWLIRSFPIPGHLYMTPNRICFYAKLPKNQDVVLKEGFFNKKSSKTGWYSRYWFVLKNDVLSWYSDRNAVYSPIKTIDLRHALAAEPSQEDNVKFNIFFNDRDYTFKMDSELARKDWVKVIKKSIFHGKMEGDKVKISIPLGNVQAIEMDTMAFTEAIKVRVMEDEEHTVDDEFNFAYFTETPGVFAALRLQLEAYQQSNLNNSEKIFDSTSLHAGSIRERHAAEGSYRSLSSFRPTVLTNLLHPDHGKARSRSRSPVKSQHPSDTEDNEKEKLRHSLSLPGWVTDHRSETTATDDLMSKEKEQEAFRKEFSLPHSESYDAVITGSLLRIIPMYGYIYLSSNYLCYRSRINSTKVIVPLEDVQSVNKEKGTMFYFHGLGLVTKNDREFFFEFSSASTRNKVFKTLQDRTTPEAQMRRMKQRTQVTTETPSLEKEDPMDSKTLESSQYEEAFDISAFSWGSDPQKRPQPMRITCLTIGSRGDVQPYIALCKRLMEHGHKCRISTHGEYKEWIEGHGIEFGLVGGDPGELIELCVENGMFTVAFIRESLKRFRGWLDELLVSAWEACQDTDVLIESPSAMAGIHIAEKLDIPYFRAFPFPWTRTRAFPHPFAVPERNLGRSYNYMTYVMIEQIFWKGISGQVNRWRKDTLGLGSTSLEKMDAHHVPVLYSWSPHVAAQPIDWPSWIHVTGYWFLDNPDLSWTPPEDLVAFLKADPKNKPVYIGFGSMVVPDPDEMTRTIIEAVTKSGVRAIISKGWSDRATSQKDSTGAGQKTTQEKIVIPPSIYMIKSVPHDWLFPQLAGCVHHGGAGTAAAGLRAGIPTVIKPFFGDQYFWAQCLEEAGVGVWCHDLTVRKLTSALVTITTDEKMIKKAQTIGEKIRQEDGVGVAIDYFYHDLGIAKQRLHKSLKDRTMDMGMNLPDDEHEREQDDQEDWLLVSSAASGATSIGEGSEGTTGMNVMSGSDEDGFSTSSEQTTPTVGGFTEFHHSGSSRGRHSRTGSEAEPYTNHSHVAGQHRDGGIEATGSRPQSFSQGESAHEREKEKGSKSAKRISARKMIGSIGSIATKATEYFVSSSSPHPNGPQTPVPGQTWDESRKTGSSEGQGQAQAQAQAQGHDRPTSSHRATPSFDAKDASKVTTHLTTVHNLR